MSAESVGDDAAVREIAAGLEDGPIHVDATAAARIPDAALAAIEQKIDALPYDVYVIVLDDAANDPGVGALVHEETGHDGVYLVTAPQGILWSDVFGDSSREMDGAQQVLSGLEVSGSGYEGVKKVQDALDALADEAGVARAGESAGTHGAGAAQESGSTASASTARETPADTGGLGQVSPDALVLGVLLVGVAAACAAAWMSTRVLRTRRNRQEKRHAGIPRALLSQAARMQRKGIRRALSDDTLELSAALVALDTDDLTEEQAAMVRHGLDAYTFAGRLVDAEDATRADLAGALVLLTVAEDDLARVRADSVGDPLCTVNPTHGEAGEARPLPLPSLTAPILRVRAGAAAPVCERCAADLRADRSPQWLMDRGRPYVERETVWARTLFGTHDADLVARVQEEIARRS